MSSYRIETARALLAR